MKAVLCRTLSGVEALTLEDLPDPVAGPGEVVVKVRVGALNFFDTLIIRGAYQFKPELPFSPCGEIAGIVESIGPDVAGITAGQRVMTYIGWGGAREKVVVRADQVIGIPNGVSDEVAAGLSVTYGTAIHGLRERGAVRDGETVAVLGAAGGAGLAAIEIAKLLGARVIAVASSEHKLDICLAAGADEVFDYASGDLKKGLRALTSGAGVDVVYDCVGGAQAEPALRATAWRGRYLVVGFASGEIPKMPLNLLLLKGCSAVGVFWGEAVKRDPTGHRENMRQVLDWVSAGLLDPRIGGSFPLAQTREALLEISKRRAKGKIVLTMD